MVMLSSSCLQLPAGAAQRADAPSSMDAKRQESAQLYLQMHRVLSHPRCLNCHPKGDSPRQGAFERLHMPAITRGPQGRGPGAMQCSSCHQERNNSASGVPGAPNWHLAPLSMGWEGLAPGTLCRALLDRKRNGNRSVEATVQHLTTDELVAWAWKPGTGPDGKPREPVPVPREEFIKLVHAWASLGAACPN